MPKWIRYSAALVVVATAGLLFAAQVGGRTAPGSVRPGASRDKAVVTRPATRPAIASTRPAGTQPASRPALSTRPSPSRVVAYYFHRTLRCQTCQRLEELAKQAVESRFSSELELGLVEWRSINFQQKPNEHFAREFGLEAPSLVLVRMEDGRQVSWRNMEKIWSLVGDPGAYAKYVQDGVVACLAGDDAARPQ